MYMKFQKLLMTGCRDMDKKHQKYPQNGFFPQFVIPQDFFPKSGSVTFVPLWCRNFMQNIRKTYEWSLRYLKTDRQTDQRTDRRTRAITRDHLRRTRGPKRYLSRLFILDVFIGSTDRAEICGVGPVAAGLSLRLSYVSNNYR